MVKRVRHIDGDDPAPLADDPDAELIREAKKRFKRSSDWESTARQYWLEDVKFANGDARNMYQWPDAVQQARAYGSGDDTERPCLTVNKTNQHCLQIINDARQNKMGIKTRPVGSGATYDAAQIFDGLFRHIEYISNAQAHYMQATTFQVQGGVGYCELVTDYAANDTFDQELFIRGCDDPLGVFLDPDHRELDGSDARFGFMFSDMARDAFEREYPDVDLPAKGTGPITLGFDEDAWISEDKVRIAKYYYRTEVKDELIAFVEPISGEQTIVKRSEMEGMSGDLRKAFDAALKDPNTKRRPLLSHEVKLVKIAGNTIVDRRDWPGDSIPIYPCVGIKTVIDGVLDRKGHVRALLDSQRMLNYNASAAVEYGALQGKTPYMAPMAAIGNLDVYWGRQNLDNLAFLPWNHVDDDGNPIPKPERVAPPSFSPLYEQGRQAAEHDMMLASGQYQPVMGEPSNERSGKAIQARQRQGENATYHFTDHQALMIRRIGKDIIQIAGSGKIYDTVRILKIVGDDGEEQDVQLDPNAALAYEKRVAGDRETAEQIIFNPSVGRYDVMSDVGPDYATRRQEAFNALSQIAAQNPELMQIIGDLVLLAADFPLADEAAERLRRMVPAKAMGEGVPPEVADLQQKLAAMQALMGSLSQKLAEATSKGAASEQQKAVDIYKAVTQRLDIIMKYTHVPEEEILRFQHDLAMQEHAAQLTAAQAANTSGLEEAGA